MICGAGNRGLDCYGAFALKHPERLRIVGVADPIPRRRELAQRRHQLQDSQIFSDWSDLVGQPKMADVAIVATPDGLHLEPTLGLMTLGYNILLEKPMALSAENCYKLVSEAERTNTLLTVCHLLRYAPYFQEIRAFLDSGKLGELVTVRHLEPVSFWRFAHSFVRGNWRREEDSAPFILAKSCHDFDLISYLVDKPCLRISSFGNLTHFRPENKPKDATERCCTCPHQNQGCPYSATRYYLDHLRQGNTDWPVNVLTDQFTEESVMRALERGPHGRCVYECDNDVVDHQVVNMEFVGGLTASFTAIAFTDDRVRETELMGTRGSLRGDGRTLTFQDFLHRRQETWEVLHPGRHLGGEERMITEFLEAVRERRPPRIDTGPRASLNSHLLAFAAETARKQGRVVTIPRDALSIPQDLTDTKLCRLE